SGNELQEVAQASGEALALHPMDAEAGRNPTSHAFQSEHCRSIPFTQLKTTFSASTTYWLLSVIEIVDGLLRTN
ncbi:MAG: hypothetical protein QF749_10470, partial [Verrucomicrobiota bacterium]|nr:hypothetical protein [Verrucomicrobiota bacterium]